MTLATAEASAQGWPDLWRVFGRIGLLSFGGPAAQIAMMHRDLVDDRKWLTEEEYLRALSLCMLLPGPEAMQLATYAGWRLKGVAGGFLAGLLFVLPGALVILALAAAYSAWGDLPFVQALFYGVKACVTVIVVEALLRVAKRALKGNRHRLIAILAFIAIYAFGVPFPIIIIAAALAGAIWLDRPAAKPAALPAHGHLVPTLGIGLAAWFAPVALVWAAGNAFLLEIGLFFSKLAVVTFGGAYAVLAYMTQTVAQDYGWLTTGQMIDALGLAETTPGPLILVTEFVAYVAGDIRGGTGLAVAAAALTLWVTFVPCFLWIFAFAPYIGWIGSRPRLQAALAGITASVVGVIGNLAVVFALHVLFARLGNLDAGPLALTVPDLTSLDFGALGILLLSGVALLRLHWPLAAVLAGSAALGVAIQAMG
jgi:chromate transporter